MSLKVGVVGATGMVGTEFLKILEQRQFPISELRPFASERSLGQEVELNHQKWPIQTLKTDCFKGLDLVFFSSGDPISKEWAPQAVSQGAFAIDNSAAFRMDSETLLVVPEVNGHLLPSKGDKPSIIANPNCSTIQLVVALAPLHKDFGIQSVQVATYQAVSGAGLEGSQELLGQVEQKDPKDLKAGTAFAHPIAFNCLPHIGSFDAQGFCSEEQKIMRETKKILEAPELKVSAFTVRLPVLNGHSEAVWVHLKKEIHRDDFLKSLNQVGDGLKIIDQPQHNQYPTALEASGTDPVYVGRIHQDQEDSKCWLMWVVADNIRKGAALNGIQIAEKIFKI